MLIAVPAGAQRRPAADARPLTVEVERIGGGLLRISARLDLPVPPDVAWAVLSDYERLADFVADLKSSRRISAPGEPLLLEQKGETGFLMFRFPLEVVLQVEERPPAFIGFHSVSGNLRELRGSWRISPREAGTRLEYTAEASPDFWVPPLIGPAVVRRRVQEQLHGLAEEILRRAGAAPAR